MALCKVRVDGLLLFGGRPSLSGRNNLASYRPSHFSGFFDTRNKIQNAGASKGYHKEPLAHHRMWYSTSLSSAASATTETVELLENKVDYEKLAQGLAADSPLKIIDLALEMFGQDIAIAFSGAEDVALIEYAHLTGRPYRVFSLDTGRLNPETYRLFADVEQRYNIHIEYMFPDASEVEDLVRTKGLFSFYTDGHQECCAVRKVRPLKRALKGLRAWITGQRRDQSPGTRANVPIVQVNANYLVRKVETYYVKTTSCYLLYDGWQVDPSFEGLDGGVGSLIKWNPLANVSGKDVWNFLRTMDVPVNTLHSQGYVSIGCEPCTRPVLPGQHEREGRWWWEDAAAKECGLHKGNVTKQEDDGKDGLSAVADLFNGESVVKLDRSAIESLAFSEGREQAALIVLYAPWCPYCQAMDTAFNEVAKQLHASDVLVGKFRADGAEKEFAQEKLQLKTFPTILFLPKSSNKVIKYPSERRDVESFVSFVRALHGTRPSI